MHVLHIIDTLGLGGAERMLVDIANATVQRGHRVSVCVTRSTTTIAGELDRRVELHVLHRKRRLSCSALELGRWARARGVDVAHVHLRHTLTLILLLRVLRLFAIPIVFHDHYGTIEIDTAVPLWFRVGNRMLSQYVGVYDRLEAWAVQAGVPGDRATTIENALDLTRFDSAARTDLRAELGLGAATTLGLCVATLRPDKSIETLIDALARARHRDELHIAVAGATGDPRYATMCADRVRGHRLERHVTFLGGRTDVPSLLRGVDIGLLSSHTESGPLVLIEYLAAALPIVATEVGEIGRRLARLGVPGFVPAHDVDAFARKLDEVVESSAASRAVRGMKGQAVLKAGWDIQNVLPRWHRVYARAIENPV